MMRFVHFSIYHNVLLEIVDREARSDRMLRLFVSRSVVLKGLG